MPPSPRRVSAQLAIVAIAIAAAMLLGGSGSLIPVPEMLLQCLLAGLTAAWVWLRPAVLRDVPRAAWIVATPLLALPLAQLVPLPPSLWHALPGRATEQAALALVAGASTWQPLTLTPDRTVASLLAMTGAAAVLVMAAAQGRAGRRVLMATMAAMALLSVLVGAAQLSGGDGNAARFYYPDEAFLDGFQANHNHAADVLLVGLVMVAAVAADRALDRRHERRPPADPRLLLGGVGGVSLLLVLGVVLTASRTGIALLPVAIGAQLLLLHRGLGLDRRRGLVAAGIGLGAAGVVLAAVGLDHGALARVWARFHASGEARPEIWRDAWYALRQYWPWGAGMGSFVPVFAAAERLEVVTPQYVNRAHDDYLEFLIEAGLPGAAALGVIVLQLARGAWRRWRTAGAAPQLMGGAAALVVISVHSLVDYPLRTMSLACMTAVCAGVMLPIRQRAEPGNVKRP